MILLAGPSSSGKTTTSLKLGLYLREKGIKFKKISLDPGAEEEVSFVINEEMLRFWTAEEKWESEAGKFLVWICNSSRDGQALEFRLI